MEVINIVLEGTDAKDGADMIQDAVLGIIMGHDIKLNGYERSSRMKLFEPPEMVEIQIPSFLKK